MAQPQRTRLPVQEMRVGSLGCKDPLEKEMASHSSIPAWEIPWTDKPGELQSMCHKRVGHDLATKQLPKYCVKYFQVNCFILLSYFQYSFLPPSLSSPLGISIMCMLISLLMSHRSLSLYSLFFFFSASPTGLSQSMSRFMNSFFCLLTSDVESLWWIFHCSYCTFQNQSFNLVLFKK